MEANIFENGGKRGVFKRKRIRMDGPQISFQIIISIAVLGVIFSQLVALFGHCWPCSWKKKLDSVLQRGVSLCPDEKKKMIL